MAGKQITAPLLSSPRNGSYGKGCSLLLAGLLAGMLVGGCAASGRFVRISRPPESEGILYVLRPSTGAWILSDFDLELLQYPGHFTGGSEKLKKRFSLSEFEYIAFSLEPGFYRLQLLDFTDTFTILHVDGGEIRYISIGLFGGGSLTTPDAMLVELEPEEAVGLLIDGEHMHTHEKSFDAKKKP